MLYSSTTQQGRVLDNNGASVTGAHDLTFGFMMPHQVVRVLV